MYRQIRSSTLLFVLSVTFLSTLLVMLLPTRVTHAALLDRPTLQEDGQSYVVKAGDSLYKIADEFYGNGNMWGIIVDATNAKAQVDPSFATVGDPRQLRIGQKLWIPNQPTSSVAVRPTTPATTTTQQPANTASERGVRIVSPLNGATVPPTFTVVMAASGVKVEPAGEIHENAGHMHILIDEDFVEPGEIVINDASHLHFGKGQLTTTLSLSPGVHVLRLQLADGAHMALDDLTLRDTITVTVSEAAAQTQARGVHFVAPLDGATVPPTFEVVMAATGVRVEPAGEIHENAGHMHILVDEDFVAPGEIVVNDATHLHFGKGQLTTTLTLSPGVHTLRLQLADGAHMALDDSALQDTITVTVAEKTSTDQGVGVHFVSPQDGATVPLSFPVIMAATGITVEPAGEIHDHAGHMHILIDEDFVDPGDIIVNDATHLHFGKGQLSTTLTLTAGIHILRLQLADGAHMALDDPRLHDTITITASEKASK
ncbi:MAG: DUF4399 domain-containing protein [Caldilineaceae bacterium]